MGGIKNDTSLLEIRNLLISMPAINVHSRKL